jgi:allantoin racemase
MLCEPIPSERPRQHWEWMAKVVDAAGAPGTVVDYVSLKQGYKNLSTYTRLYNSLQVVQRAYEAENKGYDAFIVGCASDLGMKEARSLVSIPVVGATESAIMTACTLGYKFSVICTERASCSRYESLISSYGFGERLASVRHPEGLTAQMNFAKMAQGGASQREVVDMLIAEMRKAVIQDRAEVVWVSCIASSSMVTAHGVYEVEGAPVLNLFAAGLKMAESLVGFKRAFGTQVCRKSIYQGPSEGWEKEIPIPVD